MNTELVSTDIFYAISCFLDPFHKDDIRDLIHEQVEKHWALYQEELILDIKFNDTYNND